ncbi:hypothetical protein ACFYUJ_09650 [Streptomyces sp. NPDC004520]|uniref:hypothetical protein n=1 Tax=Streptomyces sp. NPDC004520 TaxID=3364702 RepID=UPI003686E95B
MSLTAGLLGGGAAAGTAVPATPPVPAVPTAVAPALAGAPAADQTTVSQDDLRTGWDRDCRG